MIEKVYSVNDDERLWRGKMFCNVTAFITSPARTVPLPMGCVMGHVNRSN